MTKLYQIWKCKICGNIVEVIHQGADSLVCCGQPMILKEERTKDPQLEEKHIPVINGNKVKISSVEHPMTPEHYIEWIEASNGKITAKIFLNPGQKPEAEFCFIPTSAREYCNIHGLWKKGHTKS